MSIRALPSQELSEPELKAKKDALKGLKVAQLASYDDFLTDLLVDKVYFWSTIRKNRNRYSSSRYLKEEEIAKILQQRVVVEKDVQKAVDELLKLPGVRKWNDKLSEDDKGHFERHLRKYVNIYLPDCPFEVSTTNRYTIDTQEAAIAARRSIRRGDPIKYLVGVQVPITKDEEKDLDLTRRDFSIVMSSRKRLPSLFLGPARFANHDCSPNARLTTKGPNGMAVVAAKDIKVGEEIVVSYGDDYFGVDNQECLCATCESCLRNGWDPTRREESDEEDSVCEQELKPPKRKPRGRQISQSESSSRTETPVSVTGNTLKRKRGRPSDSGSSTPLRDSRFEDIRTSSFKHSPSRLRQELYLDRDEQIHGGLLDPTNGTMTPEPSRSPASIFERQQGSESSTVATSLSDHRPKGKSKADAISIDEEPVTTASIWSMPYSAIKLQDSMGSPNSSQQDSQVEAGSESGLSDLDDTMAIDDETKQVVARKKQQRQSRRLLHNARPGTLRRSSSSLTPVVVDPNDYDNPNARRQGDYTLTRRLLASPYSRWNRCRVCREYFVQFNAYQTRWSCPRCERHSKLYGYVWPKTDKEGKHDTEERILDHRQIVRFVHGEEERWIKKGKKTVDRILAGEIVSDEEVNFGANPRLLEAEEWSTDEDDEPVGRGKGGVRKPQKRDFNADGSLREKRPYQWSGKYVGRWNKRRPKSDNRKFGGVHPATATANRAATDSSPNGKKLHKTMKDGFRVQKRPYVKSGKYAGRRLKHQDSSIEQSTVYKNQNLPYGSERGRSTQSSSAPAPKEKKKKQPWKGWAIVDENGEVVSPPTTPDGKVMKARRWHPEVEERVRLDIKPEHVNKPKRTRRESAPVEATAEAKTSINSLRRAEPASASSSTNNSHQQTGKPRFAPKRVKGWVYLDENHVPLPNPPRQRSSAASLKREGVQSRDEDEDEQPAESSAALLGRFRPRNDGGEGSSDALLRRFRPRATNVDYAPPTRRISTGALPMPNASRRAAAKREYVEDTETSSSSDDDDEDEEDLEDTDSGDSITDSSSEGEEVSAIDAEAKEPPRKKRKYVRSGKYNGRKARQVARREAAAAMPVIKIEDTDDDEVVTVRSKKEVRSGKTQGKIQKEGQAQKNKGGRPRKYVRMTM